MARATEADKYHDIVVEPQGRGATYYDPRPTVYGFTTNPDWSVLAGTDSRHNLGSFATVEEALAAYPTARVSRGCSYDSRPLVRPAWCTAEYEAETGERWSDD